MNVFLLALYKTTKHHTDEVRCDPEIHDEARSPAELSLVQVEIELNVGFRPAVGQFGARAAADG